MECLRIDFLQHLVHLLLIINTTGLELGFERETSLQTRVCEYRSAEMSSRSSQFELIPNEQGPSE